MKFHDNSTAIKIQGVPSSLWVLAPLAVCGQGRVNDAEGRDLEPNDELIQDDP